MKFLQNIRFTCIRGAYPEYSGSYCENINVHVHVLFCEGGGCCVKENFVEIALKVGISFNVFTHKFTCKLHWSLNE